MEAALVLAKEDDIIKVEPVKSIVHVGEATIFGGIVMSFFAYFICSYLFLFKRGRFPHLLNFIYGPAYFLWGAPIMTRWFKDNVLHKADIDICDKEYEECMDHWYNTELHCTANQIRCEDDSFIERYTGCNLI